MRILQVHNYYTQPGGEDVVFQSEGEMLEKQGHEVLRYTVSNEDLASYSNISLASSTVWNHSQYKKLRHLFRETKPDIVHVHNTLPLISPSVYFAAKAETIPLVQMLHNYRPFCLNGVLFRDGKICEDCIGHFPISGIIHKCYRDSLSASSGIFALYLVHYKVLRTYQRYVSSFITSSQFARNIFARMGYDQEKIHVKPNMVNVKDSIYKPFTIRDKRVLFIGRLDERKGIWTLLLAIEKLNVPLTLVGDGLLRPEIKKWLAARPDMRVEITGWMSPKEVYKRLSKCSFLVLPSEFYESFGNVIVEAFSCGVPVLTTSIGAQSELVEHRHSGMLFEPGNVEMLSDYIEALINDPKLRMELGMNARLEYETKYTEEKNYETLMAIYKGALAGTLKKGS